MIRVISRDLVFLYILGFVLLPVGGCLVPEEESYSQPEVLELTSALAQAYFFPGASAAMNLNGGAIQIQWEPISKEIHILGYVIYRLADSNEKFRESDMIQVGSLLLQPIGIAPAEDTSFKHTNVTPGKAYRYIVRFIAEKDDLKDENVKIVSALAYPGITQMTPLGLYSALIFFPKVEDTDAYRIYCAEYGRDFVLKEKIEKSQALVSEDPAQCSAMNLSACVTYNLNDLKPGMTYTCHVQANDPNDRDDGNTIRLTNSTESSIPGRYQGVKLVQAYGTAPGAPDDTPKDPQVSITWKPFLNATPVTHYKLVRAPQGQTTMDVHTQTQCTADHTHSCRVCEVTGDSARMELTCTDTNVEYPNAYDYVITLINSEGQVEELPTENAGLRITVQVPPPNMVLVHRDAVNDEMCNFMNSRTEPLNHQRCPYSGMGNQPIPNPDSTYYDFGYNLFVDRWEMGCNWSQGACEFTGTINNTEYRNLADTKNETNHCYSDLPPNSANLSASALPGTLFYEARNGRCWLKNSSNSWEVAPPSSGAFTNSPGPATHRIPPVSYLNQNEAFQVCHSTQDSYYGQKRLLRHREFVAAAAFHLGTSNLAEIKSGQSHTSVHACNTLGHNGVEYASFPESELSGDGSVNNRYKLAFIIGSEATRNCVSRFGAQDMAGNMWEWVSDQLQYSTSCTCDVYADGYEPGNPAGNTVVCNKWKSPCSVKFMSSGLDPENQDAKDFQFNVAGLDRPGELSNYQSFLVPLGLPALDPSMAGAVTRLTTVTGQDPWYLVNWQDDLATAPVYGLLAGGTWNGGPKTDRFTTKIYREPTQSVGFRCALHSIPSE